MTWQMRARVLESCSCKVVCRCNFGPAEPDQGWCSAAIAIHVLDGESDGVDVSGAKILLVADLPGDFLGGIDKARIYLDADLSEDQRRELDAIFHGERGGVWAGLREAIASWLPSGVTKIDIVDDDKPRVTAEGIGEMTLAPLTTQDGHRTTLHSAPIPADGFGQDALELAVATGSGFAAADMRAWESLGYGATSTVRWSG